LLFSRRANWVEQANQNGKHCEEERQREADGFSIKEIIGHYDAAYSSGKPPFQPIVFIRRWGKFKTLHGHGGTSSALKEHGLT